MPGDEPAVDPTDTTDGAASDGDAPATVAAAAIAEAAGRLDLSTSRAVHLVGIGGAGMSAIAEVLVAMGHRVTGSDLKESTGLARPPARGVEVTIGHDAANVADDVDFLAISTAIPAHNLEVRAAEAAGVPVVRRAELLAAIAATRRTVAVAGTHGKTTTSSMLALVLIEAGQRPVVHHRRRRERDRLRRGVGRGRLVRDRGRRERRLRLRHAAATRCIVTNVEPDHLEFHGSVDGLHRAFGALPGRDARARGSCAPTTRSPPASAAPWARSPTARPGRRPIAWSTSEVDEGA